MSMYFHYVAITWSPWKRVNKLWIPSQRMLCAKFSQKLALWFWRVIFLKVVNIFSLFVYKVLLEKKCMVLPLYKLEFPSTKYVLLCTGLKLAQWFLRRCHGIFTMLLLPPLWNIWTKLNNKNGQNSFLWLRWAKCHSNHVPFRFITGEVKGTSLVQHMRKFCKICKDYGMTVHKSLCKSICLVFCVFMIMLNDGLRMKK